jgi:hypothetical protein
MALKAVIFVYLDLKTNIVYAVYSRPDLYINQWEN